MLNCFMNGSTRLRSASTLTETTTKLRSLYVSYIFWTTGSSFLQGPHQVAQTFKRTTLPFSSDRRTLPPSEPTNSRSGKVGSDACCCAWAGAPANAKATTAARESWARRIRVSERAEESEYSVGTLRSG